jgi:RNase P/RNase MRP subunit p29
MYNPVRLALRPLIGLTAAVKHSTNPILRGVSGVIVNDTENMLVLADGLRHRHIPKASSLFTLSLPDGETAEIHGKALLGHPAERLRRAKRLRW